MMSSRSYLQLHLMMVVWWSESSADMRLSGTFTVRSDTVRILSRVPAINPVNQIMQVMNGSRQ